MSELEIKKTSEKHHPREKTKREAGEKLDMVDMKHRSKLPETEFSTKFNG